MESKLESKRMPKDTRAGGSEDPYVSLEDDDRQDRRKWCCRVCPLDKECSATSLKKARLFSYISEETCRQYVSNHLHRSSKHSLQDNKETCDEYAREANIISVEVETFEDREIDREWYAKQATADEAWAASNAAAEASGKQAGSLGSVEWYAQEREKELEEEVQEEMAQKTAAIEKKMNEAAQAVKEKELAKVRREVQQLREVQQAKRGNPRNVSHRRTGSDALFLNLGRRNRNKARCKNARELVP